MSQSEKNPSFEEALTEINELIKKLELESQTLEQSLDHFEKGIKLIKHCQILLTHAEQKVQILMENNQREQLTDYEPDNKNESAHIEQG